jgi:hypothetical protein
MNCFTPPLFRYATTLLLFAITHLSVAQEITHLNVAIPGGMPGRPVMTGIFQTTNGFQVTWAGPSGYYQLFQTPTLDGSSWKAIGGRTNFSGSATVPASGGSSFFRVSGPTANYAGSRNCADCHGSTVTAVAATPHTRALQSLREIGQDKNPDCLKCHTVGYGLPTGYKDQASTAHLAGVQCENCHGPAANHSANPEDFTVIPKVDLAAEVCGGCHQGNMVPAYPEWKTSGHSIVTEDMNPPGRISSCGRCHSGSARLALLEGEPLPVGDANVPVTCVVCHEPHATTANPYQLRNPTYSTKDYFLTTTDDFAAKYDPSVHICAQCHNHRGAAWTNTSRPPHHSPQYNMLLGTVGELASGQKPNDPATHAFLEKQCVTCHMHAEAFVSEEQPAKTGHSFAVTSYESCLACHPKPEQLADFVMQAVSLQIEDVKDALNLWATTKAPEELRSKYGQRSWEYTVPGSLSSGGPGPSTSEQSLIPDPIKKARFDLYLVLHDGSFGVHNGPYAITLLNAAMDWVRSEINR